LKEIATLSADQVDTQAFFCAVTTANIILDQSALLINRLRAALCNEIDRGFDHFTLRTVVAGGSRISKSCTGVVQIHPERKRACSIKLQALDFTGAETQN
jgi:hypothetical protein